MRRLLAAGALGIVTAALSACGGSDGNATSDETLQRDADVYAIGQMMRLWAPNATFTFGPGQTAAGTEQIRQVWLTKTKPFSPEINWVSDHPAYKLRVTVNGDRGTLHFECHFIDMKTHKVAAVTAADQDVARIDGRWLITNMVGSTTELSP